MSDHWAKEADRLLADTTLKKALDDVRQNALEALATANADDTTMILRMQGYIAAVDDIRSQLRLMVLRQGDAASNEASPFA